ncbi:MAG: dTDP-4-dehydrorhamnose reductase [Pseudomonadales bacterium]|jgi:dTDP-4-dehydrorhamnose reductase|nr:dTDP-4-dehydrorhamnose reductase [Pseudomonadales bacterium]
MRILLLGAEGQLGTSLRRSLGVLGELIALGRGGAPGLTGDLRQERGLRETIRTVRPDVLVNAAAYTDVDGAESSWDAAFVVNGHAPGVLAEELARTGGLLVHYSTEHVFDGSGTRGWREDDPVAPVNAYGRSKLIGEDRVRTSGGHHLILRTSWVYAAHGRNFLRSMLRHGATRDRLEVVQDQRGSPTSAELVADVTAHCLRQTVPEAGRAYCGTYHVTARGGASRLEYVRELVGRARRVGLPLRVRPEDVAGVGSDHFPAPAERPRNSTMCTTRIEETFGLRMPPWQRGVQEAIELLADRAG